MSTETKPMDLDRLLTVDEFLGWLGKDVTKSTRFWANRQARLFKETKGDKGIPAVKLGAEWRFHPRTILATGQKGVL